MFLKKKIGETRTVNVLLCACRRWRQVGESPPMWSWLCLTVTASNLSAMPEVLGSRRLQAVSTIWLWAASEQLLMAITRHPGLSQV